MQNSESENMDINEELEFNNGVGDALKQKEEYTFSWKKTSIILLLGVVVFILVTFGVLEVGKSALNINQETISQDEPLNMDQPLKDLNEANQTNWDVLPEDTQDVISEPKGVAEKEVVPQQKAATPKKEIGTNKVVTQKKDVTIKKTVTTQKTTKKSIYRVIAGSFSNYNNAKTELEKIKSKGFDGYIWSLTSPQKVVSYKVQVGAFKSSNTAQKLVTQLQNKNIASFISKH